MKKILLSAILLAGLFCASAPSLAADDGHWVPWPGVCVYPSSSFPFYVFHECGWVPPAPVPPPDPTPPDMNPRSCQDCINQ